ITLDPADILETSFIASADPGVDVEMGIWNARDVSNGNLGAPVDVQTGTTWGEFGVTKATATIYNTQANDLSGEVDGGLDLENNPALITSILNGADYYEIYYVVTNRVTDSIMNFNYQVTTDYTLDLGTVSELDHCNANINTHDIGVNGAVLKVPYAVSG